MKRVLIFIFILLVGTTSVQTKSVLGAEKNASSTDQITENDLQSGQSVGSVKRESADNVKETQKELEPITRKKSESATPEQNSEKSTSTQTTEQPHDKNNVNSPARDTQKNAPEEVTVEEVKVEDRDPLRAKTLTSGIACNKKIRISGYFAPMVRMGEVNGSFAAFAGAKGGVMLNDFVIGGAYFIYTDYKKCIINTHNHKVLTQYGGMVLEYNFFRREVVNFSLGTIIGGGTSGYYYRKNNDDDDDDHDYDYRYKGTNYFVMEPEIMLYVNIARFFRIGVGASYRYTNGLDKYGLTDKTFDGFNGLVMLQFGWF